MPTIKIATLEWHEETLPMMLGIDHVAMELKKIAQNDKSITIDLSIVMEKRDEKEDAVAPKKRTAKKGEKKIPYAEGVLLKLEEFEKLKTAWGPAGTQVLLDTLSNYKMSNGKKYKSDYHAMFTWVIPHCIEKAMICKPEENVDTSAFRKKGRR